MSEPQTEQSSHHSVSCSVVHRHGPVQQISLTSDILSALSESLTSISLSPVEAWEIWRQLKTQPTYSFLPLPTNSEKEPEPVRPEEKNHRRKLRSRQSSSRTSVSASEPGPESDTTTVPAAAASAPDPVSPYLESRLAVSPRPLGKRSQCTPQGNQPSLKARPPRPQTLSEPVPALIMTTVAPAPVPLPATSPDPAPASAWNYFSLCSCTRHSTYFRYSLCSFTIGCSP